MQFNNRKYCVRVFTRTFYLWQGNRDDRERRAWAPSLDAHRALCLVPRARHSLGSTAESHFIGGGAGNVLDTGDTKVLDKKPALQPPEEGTNQ